MHQSEYIAATKKSIADHYVQSAPEKFACMVALENTAGIGGANKLNSLIFIEIDRARRDTTKDHQVEDIIFGVTERECTNVD